MFTTNYDFVGDTRTTFLPIVSTPGKIVQFTRAVAKIGATHEPKHQGVCSHYTPPPFEHRHKAYCLTHSAVRSMIVQIRPRSRRQAHSGD